MLALAWNPDDLVIIRECVVLHPLHVVVLGLTVEWSPEDLAEGRVVTVPDDVYARGCVRTAEEGLSAAQNICFPVMIKASEGGGGKGIRKSTNADDFPNLFRQVRYVTKVNFNAVQVHIITWRIVTQ